MFEPVRLHKLKKPLVVRLFIWLRKVKAWFVKDC